MMIKEASGFDQAAVSYERARPAYPDVSIQALVEGLHIDPASPVLDVGAGTGKLSRQLQKVGARVIAADQSRGMLNTLTSQTVTIPAVLTRAEALPFRDRSFHAVVAAQAFHWFDSNDALAEFRRVLQPSGGLGLIWNVRDTVVSWVRAVETLLEPFRGGAPRWMEIDWRAIIERSSFFPTVLCHELRWVRSLTVEQVLANISSRSYVASLDPVRRERLLRSLEARLGSLGYSSVYDTVDQPMVTRTYWSPLSD